MNVENVEWNPERGQNAVAVVDVYINDTLYHVPCVDYDEAIAEGRTKFAVLGDHVKMITPEQYKLLEEVIEKIKKAK
jgi:hypothetical protein